MGSICGKDSGEVAIVKGNSAGAPVPDELSRRLDMYGGGRGWRQALAEDRLVRVRTRQKRFGAHDDQAVWQMMHMDRAAPQLENGIGDGDFKEAREIGDRDEIDARPAIRAMPGFDRDPAADGLDAFDLNDELLLRRPGHSASSLFVR